MELKEFITQQLGKGVSAEEVVKYLGTVVSDTKSEIEKKKKAEAAKQSKEREKSRAGKAVLAAIMDYMRVVNPDIVNSLSEAELKEAEESVMECLKALDMFAETGTFHLVTKCFGGC